MDTAQSSNNSQIPAYRRPASRPMKSTGFRVYQDQLARLDKEYQGRGSEVVRVLLDKFFRGELLDVKEQLSCK